jgi:hypothetical protein
MAIFLAPREKWHPRLEGTAVDHIWEINLLTESGLHGRDARPVMKNLAETTKTLLVDLVLAVLAAATVFMMMELTMELLRWVTLLGMTTLDALAHGAVVGRLFKGQCP